MPRLRDKSRGFPSRAATGRYRLLLHAMPSCVAVSLAWLLASIPAVAGVPARIALWVSASVLATYLIGFFDAGLEQGNGAPGFRKKAAHALRFLLLQLLLSPAVAACVGSFILVLHRLLP